MFVHSFLTSPLTNASQNRSLLDSSGLQKAETGLSGDRRIPGGVCVLFRGESPQNGWRSLPAGGLISCNQRPWKIGSTCKKLRLRVDKDKAGKSNLPLRPHSGTLPYLTLKKSLMMSNKYLLDVFVRVPRMYYSSCASLFVCTSFPYAVRRPASCGRLLWML